MADSFSVDLMTADRVAQMEGEYEPQRTNNAVLHIFGVGGDEELKLALRTFPLPKGSNGVIESDWINEKRKVAGKAVFEDMELAFEDYCDRDTAALLWDWRLEVYDPSTGQVGLARDYKKRGEITLFAPNGDFQRVWTCFGMWPSNMDPGDIDHAGEDIVRVNMTVTIDKAIYGTVESSTSQAPVTAFS